MPRCEPRTSARIDNKIRRNTTRGELVRRRKWVATSAVLAVVGAFASAGIAASGVPGAGAQSSVRGVTSNSISVAGLTQASQFTANELKTGATARFQVENNKGGVFGRKINYVER